MGIAFARARYLPRSSGGSAVRSAAYNAREALEAERTGELFHFRHRDAPEHHEVLLPKGADARLADAAVLWNAAEAAEKRKDRQVAREIVLALPVDRELTTEDRIELARTFAAEHFVSKGLAVQLDVHAPHRERGEGEGAWAEGTGGDHTNWHAHLLITTRRVEGDQLAAKKARDLDPEIRKAGARTLVTDAEAWGETWRAHQDRYFQEHGIGVRVDATGLRSSCGASGALPSTGARGRLTREPLHKNRDMCQIRGDLESHGNYWTDSMSNASARQRWRHPLFALLLPAALVALGVWQLSRVEGAAADFEGRAKRIEASMARLQPLAAREPNAEVRFNNNPRTYTASQAMQEMQDARTDLQRSAWIDWARNWTAWVTVAGSAVAFVAGLCGLLAATAGARRGRKSRTELVSAFHGVVRVLPVLLGGVAVGTAVAVLGAILFEIGGAWFLESISAGEVKLILLGLLLGVGMVVFAVSSVRQLRSALDAFTPHPLRLLARAATPADAPGLWAFLREVAVKQGAAVPDNIVLGLTDGFFVTSSNVLIAPEQRLLTGRTLHLPATYLPLLSRAETSAVLAHELAHFTGEDTQYSQHFLPLFASIGRTMDAVSNRKRAQSPMEGAFQPAAVLAAHVLDTFQRTVSHWSRLREFEADRASVHVEQGRAIASALLRVGMGGQLIGGTLRQVYERPSRADDDVVGSVLAQASTAGFTNPDRHLEDRQPHPTDSHPPTRQRIEALGIPIEPPLLAQASRPVQAADQQFAEAMFVDWAGFRRQLGADLVAVARQRDKQWQASLEAAAGAVTAETPIHERSRLAAFGIGVPAVILLGMGAFTAWVALGSDWLQSDDRLLAACTAAAVAVAGAFLLMLAVYRHRRGQAGPFLTVGPAGFSCIGVAGPIGWGDVDAVQVTVGRVFLTTFRIADAASLPVQAGHRWAVKIDRRKRLLVLKGFVPLGMKPQEYLNLLNRALRAYRAREMLERRAAEAAE